MAAIAGSVDDQGSPHITVSISRESEPGLAKAFEALIDTGFTGFLQMPVDSAEALGLVAIGELPVTYGDGSTSPVPVALVSAWLGADVRDGFAHLEAGTTEVLVGVHFLRLFRRTLLFSAADGQVALTERTVSDMVRHDSSP